MVKEIKKNQVLKNNLGLIVKYLYRKAKEQNSFVGSTKIQKLLWYSQLLYYCKQKKLLFEGENNFEAWEYGPVIKNLWRKFPQIVNEKYEDQDNELKNSYQVWEEYIIGKDTKYNNEFWKKLKETQENKGITEVLDKIFDFYKNEHGWRIALKTHNHEPWKEKYSKDEKLSIDENKIKQYAEVICKREKLI